MLALHLICWFYSITELIRHFDKSLADNLLSAFRDATHARKRHFNPPGDFLLRSCGLDTLCLYVQFDIYLIASNNPQ